MGGEPPSTIAAMESVLDLSAGLPETVLEPGQTLVVEGAANQSIWVLVSGRLAVAKSDQDVNSISAPGALIGEVSVLLERASTATVRAVEPSRMRYAEDGLEFLMSHPTLIRHVAMGLADRLDSVTTYLADLKDQYADAPGLAMIPSIVGRLSVGGTVAVVPGSAREPDPLY